VKCVCSAPVGLVMVDEYSKEPRGSL
jgi:hypothetical protein